MQQHDVAVADEEHDLLARGAAVELSDCDGIDRLAGVVDGRGRVLRCDRDLRQASQRRQEKRREAWHDSMGEARH